MQIIHAVGVDINPLSLLIAEAKASDVDVRRLKALNIIGCHEASHSVRRRTRNHVEALSAESEYQDCLEFGQCRASNAFRFSLPHSVEYFNGWEKGEVADWPRFP